MVEKELGERNFGFDSLKSRMNCNMEEKWIVVVCGLPAEKLLRRRSPHTTKRSLLHKPAMILQTFVLTTGGPTNHGMGPLYHGGGPGKLAPLAPSIAPPLTLSNKYAVRQASTASRAAPALAELQ
ncbi:unnamed protein product [Boreogadus saida]